MRASKEGWDVAFSMGGGSLGDAITTWGGGGGGGGDVPRSLPLSLYLLRGGRKIIAPRHHHKAVRQDVFDPGMW